MATLIQSRGNTLKDQQRRKGSDYGTRGNTTDNIGANAVVDTPSVETQTDTTTDTPTGDTTTQTMADMFGGLPSVETMDPTMESIYGGYKADATQTVDPKSVRKDITNQFSDRLTSLGSIYDRQLEKVTRQQQETNDAELGRARALEARGIGGYSGVVKQNRRGNQSLLDATQTVADAKTLALDKIYGDIDTLTASETASKRAAKAAGGANYLNYLKEKGTKKTDYANQLAESLLNDPAFADKVFTDGELDELAKRGASLGLTRGDVATAYRKAKAEYDAAKAEKAAQEKKDLSFSLSEGESYYEYNPETGKYDQIASKAKTYAPSGGGAGVGGGGIAGSALVNQPGYSNLTTAQKKAADSLNNLVRSVDDYYAHVRDNANGFGTDLTGESSAVTSSKLNGILFAAAQAEGTGALQKADRDVITQMFPDPSSLSSLGAVFRGGKEGQLKAIKEQRDKYAQNLAGYGLVPVAGGTAASISAPVPQGESLVEVISPEGVEGTVLESELEAYISEGYTPL